MDGFQINGVGVTNGNNHVAEKQNTKTAFPNSTFENYKTASGGGQRKMLTHLK